MYILGISGWKKRGHDASACLIKDGELLYFVEEERLIRRKHSYDVLPHNSIGFCLNEAGISVEDLDYLAISWDYPHHYKIRKMNWKLNKKKLLDMILPKSIFDYENGPKIKFINHHLSHAYSAFRCSGFKDSLILVIDGQGEELSTSMWYGNKNNIEFQKGWGIGNSLGYFYESVSDFVGLEPSEPGKLMGLTAYGKPKYSGKFFKKTKNGYESSIGKIKPKYMDEENLTRKKWRGFLSKNIGKRNTKEIEFKNRFGLNLKNSPNFSTKIKNLAASAQVSIEDIILHLIKLGLKENDSKNLCLGGGVALNCLSNGRVLTSGLVDNIFIQPAANDAGGSLGAAMELCSSLGHKSKFKLNNVYYGPKFSNKEIKNTLDDFRLKYEYHKDISGVGSELLSKDKILGWFQGRMEFGPRALGNRSILANPSDPKMKDKINKKVKHREWFRPFAPSILEGKQEKYLENSSYSPFMLFTFKVRKGRQKEVPAITHVDGTTRPQTVRKKINPLYHELIKKFESQTSLPVVLNTSFNTRGEPIVCTPIDAIETFYSSGLDYLLIGNYLVKKR